jgi:hypothetical protein
MKWIELSDLKKETMYAPVVCKIEAYLLNVMPLVL